MLNSLAIAKLILEIQVPSLEECWDDGNVLSATHTLEENPYKQGTANFYHWQEGWWSGKLKDESDSAYQKQAANDDTLEQEEFLDLAYNMNSK